jgi:flagellar basal body rod protein FlgB
MNLLPLITDNITEVIVMIIEFTQTRQKILIQNIENAHSPGFIPQDLKADEFSDLLNGAIDEHIHNQRLVLRDTEHVKFGVSGSFEASPVADEHAKELLEEDRDKYVESQISKLVENSLNQRIAAELLRQKQGTATINYHNQETWEIENSTCHE